MKQSPEQVQALADAMWQLLDDMRTSGQCACLLAIAEARVAFEPFRDDDPDANADLMPLDVAQKILGAPSIVTAAKPLSDRHAVGE